MNKYELLRRVKELEIDPETKEAIVKFVEEHKKYGLVWEDKPEAVEQRLETELPVLDEVTERAVLFGKEPTPGPSQEGSKDAVLFGKEPTPGPSQEGSKDAVLFGEEPTPGPSQEGREDASQEGSGKGLFPEESAQNLSPVLGGAPSTLSPLLGGAPSTLSPLLGGAPSTLSPLLGGAGGGFFPKNKENEKENIGQAERLPNHILIEGDNLHALTCLAFTHERAVDVIYIDPPYNTGNKDFRYNDRYVDKEDGYRHSKWLSFMHKRLRLAKKLLKDTGVIFISIDDNEQAQLKLLCDGIFGQENFVANYFWMRTSTPPSLSTKVRKKLEFIVCYEKVSSNRKMIGGITAGGDMPLMNETNKVATLSIPKEALNIKIKDGTYKPGIYDKVELIDEFIVNNGKATKDLVIKGKFKWKQETVLDEISKNTTFWLKSDKFSLRYERTDERIKTPSNIISKTECEVGTNEDGKKELDAILPQEIFTFPKPVSLIKYLVNFINNPSALVLDFFAGSGTTLHAVMALNAEDGGNRQCILVTDNENGIAEEVCYERCKRVIQGYTNAKGAQVAGLTRNNLRYYRTGFVDTSLPSFGAKREITRRATGMLCIRHGCYTELPATTRDGLASSDVIRLFGDKGTESGATCRLLIVYDEDAVDTAVQVVKAIPHGLPIYVYVFSPSYDPYTEDFYPVIDRIRLLPIPQAIYNAYKFARRHGVSDSPPVSEED